MRVDAIPAIFVDFEECNPGQCLNEVTKQNKELVNADRTQVLLHFRKMHEELNTSDKENKLNEKPANVNGARSSLLQTTKDECDELLMCSADTRSCIVHSSAVSRNRWFYIHDQYQIEQLVNALNKRGIREGELSQVLQNDKGSLVDVILKTPVTQLNPRIQMDESAEQKSLKLKKSGKSKYDDANLGFPPETDLDEVLHLTLVDYILEMEEKISAGNLGSLKVKDRIAWRECLFGRNYSKLNKTIARPENGKHLKVKKEGMTIQLWYFDS